MKLLLRELLYILPTAVVVVQEGTRTGEDALRAWAGAWAHGPGRDHERCKVLRPQHDGGLGFVDGIPLPIYASVSRCSLRQGNMHLCPTRQF